MRNFPRVLLLGIIGTILLGSCQGDKEPQLKNTSPIIGYWKEIIDVEEGVQIYNTYAFLEDGSYNRSIAYINSNTNSLLGYSGKSDGTFTLVNDQLSTQTTVVYNVPESAEAPYVSHDQLVQVSENYASSVTVAFSENQNEMTWIHPPCGEPQNCIESQVFDRYVPL
ncbi:hypothetical protein J2X69_000077 [Algoriphagus sp. 4150]|uniref:hypothetical protein n=1 Tax=Algoriphagus sp. 4150 TaxID=2817756 RepID=UPI0028605ECA|nr:hypothetical protein [Algoriphagus sp. 4150]MDR7127749.1 hypothetical protein [Algoriphagus sp. 4150]